MIGGGNRMKRYLVTITDNISPTSMPYNEFVLYRREHEPEEKQIVILLFKTKVDKNETVPKDLELHCIGKDRAKLSSVVDIIVARAKEDLATVVFHIHEAKSVLLFNLATCGKYKNRIVYTLHSTYRNYRFHNKLFAQLASRQCGQVVCVSKTSYKYYPEGLKRKLAERVCFIQNGVDTDRIDKVGGNTKQNECFTLIYVARLIELKRHKMLFDAIRKLSNISLKLIGSGSLEQELRQEAEGLNVEFKGSMPRDKVYEELKKADAYVSTSSYEGLPIGVLEAMRCGLPCVLSDIEQHREIAEKCGELILCPDDGWTEVLAKLVGMNKEELRREGEQNASDAGLYFSLATMHGEYKKVYSKVER